jgi:neutral ceramidase
MTFKIGAARTDITPVGQGLPFFGWGDIKQVSTGVATPLYARAVVITDESSGKNLILCCLEIGIMSEHVRIEVVKRLRETPIENFDFSFLDDELILSATHTHSAPGGFSSYVLYSLTVLGFIPHVFESYVNGAVEAIREAIQNRVAGKVRVGTSHFSDDVPVAFNRSVRAWNRNPEVKKVSRKDRHLAVDREMVLLRFDDLAGRPLALWNWFAVHGTSMHRQQFLIHSDNKGLASSFTEDFFQKQGHRNFVAVFAQGPAGDVSPNFKRYRGLREKRGVHKDDEMSCRANAEFQFRQAKESFEKAMNSDALSGGVDSLLEFHDLSRVEIAPGMSTGPSELGMPQLYGTAEGRAATLPMIWAMTLMVRVSQLYNFVVDGVSRRPTRWPWTPHPVQGNKVTVIESGRNLFLETSRIDQIVVPGKTHPTIATLKRWAKKGLLKQRPMSPQILPIQFSRIGSFGIASVPSEFTTISGLRLRKLLEQKLKSQGITRVVVQAYANAYSGYVATPEEYSRQAYEGGCTHFGKWTLNAYLFLFEGLVARLNSGERPLVKKMKPQAPGHDFLSGIEIPAKTGWFHTRKNIQNSQS